MKSKMPVLFASFILCLAINGMASAATNVADSLKAFKAASERFEENYNNYLPMDKMENEEELGLSNHLSILDDMFRPLFNLGTSKQSMENEKEKYGWNSVKYEEKGNKFRIVCATPDYRDTYEVTYDPDADSLLCKMIRMEGRSWGPFEEYFEYRRTDFGYIFQFYSVSDGMVNKVAIHDGDGIMGVDERIKNFEPFLGNETPDYPKNCRSWYELSGNRFVIKPRQGPPREYKIKR
jgi:hypothetical protein